MTLDGHSGVIGQIEESSLYNTNYIIKNIKITAQCPFLIASALTGNSIMPYIAKFRRNS